MTPLRFAIDLTGALLEGDRRFKEGWLASNFVVPFLAPAAIDTEMAQRLFRGYSRIDVNEIVCARVGVEYLSDQLTLLRFSDADSLVGRPWRGTDFLVASYNLEGVLLISTAGFALLGGSANFVDAAVPEGRDEAKARFGRAARRLSERRQHLADIAELYPPCFRSWASAEEVLSGTSVARQLELMEQFVRVAVSPSSFAAEWLEARTQAMRDGERVRGVLGRVLDDVFFVLEEYPIDPAFRQDGDVSEQALRAAVASALRSLSVRAG